jgi:hypothetical protein
MPYATHPHSTQAHSSPQHLQESPMSSQGNAGFTARVGRNGSLNGGSGHDNHTLAPPSCDGHNGRPNYATHPHSTQAHSSPQHLQESPMSSQGNAGFTAPQVGQHGGSRRSPYGGHNDHAGTPFRDGHNGRPNYATHPHGTQAHSNPQHLQESPMNSQCNAGFTAPQVGQHGGSRRPYVGHNEHAGTPCSDGHNEQLHNPATGKKKRGRKTGSRNANTLERERLISLNLPYEHLLPKSKLSSKKTKTTPRPAEVYYTRPVTTWLQGDSCGPGKSEAAIPAREETSNRTIDNTISHLVCDDSLPPNLDAKKFMKSDTPHKKLVRQYQTMFVDLSNGGSPKYSCNTMYQDWERANIVNTLLSLRKVTVKTSPLNGVMGSDLDTESLDASHGRGELVEDGDLLEFFTSNFSG